MIGIGNDVVAAFDRQAEDAFIDPQMAYLREKQTLRARRYCDDELRQRVEWVMRRARSHGFTRQSSIAKLVALMFRNAPCSPPADVASDARADLPFDLSAEQWDAAENRCDALAWGPGSGSLDARSAAQAVPTLRRRPRHRLQARALDRLHPFLEDGRVCLTKNAAERAQRGLALGTRAPLFAGSDRGGRRAAFLYSLTITARQNDIEPQAWLGDVPARIADHPANRIDELLSWNWTARQAAAQAA